MSTSLENNITATLIRKTWLEQQYRGANRANKAPERLRRTKTTTLWVKLLRCRNTCQMPLQKAVAMRHANVFTAPFLCFRSFPVAPSQLKTPARMKKHFPRLYSGKTHSLRPRNRRHFPINLDRNAIFNGKNNGTTYANSELRLQIQWKTLARQKTDMGLHSHPIVWRRSTTKGCEQSRQKNVSGEMKRNGAWDKRMRVWMHWKSPRWTKQGRREKAWN